MSSRRNHILEVATEVILTKGFGGASMRDIASAAGMEASSLYNHISNKQDILESICMEIGNMYLQELDDILSKEDSYKKKVRAIITLHVRLSAEYKEKMIVFDQEWRHLEDRANKEFVKMRKRYEQKLAAFFQYGMEQKKIVIADPQVMVYTFLSGLKWLNYYFKDNKVKNVDKIVNDIYTIYHKGFLKN